MECDFSFRLGNDDEYVKITLTEVHGFPDEIAYGGGYGSTSTVEIAAGWFQANAVMSVTTGEIYRFYRGLQSCFERLDGEVEFANECNELDFTVSFSPKNGHVIVEGECRELLASTLNFVLELDQTYIPEAIHQLSRIVAEFGDENGVPTK